MKILEVAKHDKRNDAPERRDRIVCSVLTQSREEEKSGGLPWGFSGGQILSLELHRKSSTD